MNLFQMGHDDAIANRVSPDLLDHQEYKEGVMAGLIDWSRFVGEKAPVFAAGPVKTKNRNRGHSHILGPGDRICRIFRGPRGWRTTSPQLTLLRV